ncbi:L-threonylcarbamoyladenylate synthase [Cnuella takakiae]|nr:L-threonylcarbamoyladenylate synthase [Cnuella takakiae]
MAYLCGRNMIAQYHTITGTDTARAAQYLREGHCIAMPTETVYGLAADAFNPEAVARVFATKERPATNPLIVHLADVAQVDEVATGISDTARLLLQHFAPGPLTLLLPRKAHIPDAVTSGLPRVAVRFPAHPVAQALIRAAGMPLVAPSANRYTRISPTTPAHVLAQLDGRIPYILDGGACTAGLESTIVGFENNQPVVYRVGALPLEALEAVVPGIQLANGLHRPVVAPGMHHLHYAPRIPLTLTNDVAAVAATLQEPYAVINFSEIKQGLNTPYQLVLSPQGDTAEAARNLYAALHQAEALPVSRIIAEVAPEKGEGCAINDRLSRAAH